MHPVLVPNDRFAEDDDKGVHPRLDRLDRFPAQCSGNPYEYIVCGQDDWEVGRTYGYSTLAITLPTRPILRSPSCCKTTGARRS